MSYAVRRVTADQYLDWLLDHNVDASDAQQVLSGFKLNQPLIEEAFEVGDRLFQYIRGISFWDQSATSGSWFTRAGASPASLSILEGPAGRRLHRFTVVSSFRAVEGTVKRLPPNEFIGIGGGHGGASQVFVPRAFRGCIRAVGAQERW
jgi:hypothetical protein